MFQFKTKIVKVGQLLAQWVRPTPVKIIAVNVFGLLFIGYLAWWAFNDHPYVVGQLPAADQTWETPYQPLVITFDKAVRQAPVRLNIAPDIQGTLEWQPLWPKLPFIKLSRKLIFHPTQSLPTDQTIFTYVVGMQSIWGGGGVHEGALEFNPPAIPSISSLSIQDKQSNVIADEDLIVQFSNDTSLSADWQFTLMPETEFTVNKVSGTEWQVHWDEPLHQGASYKLSIDRASQIVDLNTKEVLVQDEFQHQQTITFTTAKAAAIKSISPQGESVLPSEKIVIVFEQAMNKESVESNFHLTPETAGSFSWKKDTEVAFTPTSNLPKDTSFVITLAKETRNKVGGLLSKEVVSKFKTVGAAKVISFSPKDGLKNVQVNNIIKVEFNQPMDKKSVEKHLVISPATSGSLSWKKNMLTFSPKSYLSYGKTYTVKISSGAESTYGYNSSKDYTASFTTAPQTVLLNVPWYRQQESYTCNIAATRMVLGYYGVSVSETTIKNSVGIGQTLNGSSGGDPYADWINNYGVYWGPIASYINKYRSTSIKTGWNINGLTSEVSKGHPVIIWWHNGWSDWYWKDWTTSGGKSIHGLNGMHSEVVAGFKGPANNPTHIITRDPWRGTRTYTASYFDNLWRSSFNRTGVVVY